MATHALAEYIAFLGTRTVKDIPARIQEQTLPLHCDRYSIASNDGSVVLCPGRDPNLCLSTAAALMLWLCGKEWRVCEIPERRDFSVRTCRPMLVQVRL